MTECEQLASEVDKHTSVIKLKQIDSMIKSVLSINLFFFSSSPPAPFYFEHTSCKPNHFRDKLMATFMMQNNRGGKTEDLFMSVEMMKLRGHEWEETPMKVVKWCIACHMIIGENSHVECKQCGSACHIRCQRRCAPNCAGKNSGKSSIDNKMRTFVREGEYKFKKLEWQGKISDFCKIDEKKVSPHFPKNKKKPALKFPSTGFFPNFLIQFFLTLTKFLVQAS